MSHRTPPKPEGYRKDWREWGVLSTSAAQRKALPRNAMGYAECHYCRKMVAKFEAEHEVALHTIPPSKLEDYPACLWYWTIANLKASCLPCHKAKSAKERTNNAKVKRIVKKLSGEKKPSQFPKLSEEAKERRREWAKQARRKAVEAIKASGRYTRVAKTNKSHQARLYD